MDALSGSDCPTIHSLAAELKPRPGTQEARLSYTLSLQPTHHQSIHGLSRTYPHATLLFTNSFSLNSIPALDVYLAQIEPYMDQFQTTPKKSTIILTKMQAII